MQKTFAGDDRAITILADRARPIRAGDNAYADSKTSGRRSTRVARPSEPEGKVPDGRGQIGWGAGRLLPGPRLEPPERRARGDPRRAYRGHERCRVPDPRALAANHRHRPSLRPGSQGSSRRLTHRRRGVRSVSSAEPRRAEAEKHRKGHRLHAVAGERSGRRNHRCDALLQGPHPRRTARGTRAAPRPAGSAR